MIRLLWAMLVAWLLAGCVTTREPPVPLASAETQHALPLVLRVIAEPSPDAQLDRLLCERVVADLRSTQFFTTVRTCGDATEAALTVRASWYTPRSAEDWCVEERNLGVSLITAGIIPFCSCQSSYALQFVGRPAEPTVTVQLDREACMMFGWYPLFLNFRPDYHWYGTPDPKLRSRALRAELSKVRHALAALAGSSAPVE